MPTWLSVRAVGVEDVVGPGGRVVCGDRSETRDEEIDAEGEAELFALEPLRQNGGDGNDHRLGAEAEDGPARDHHAGLAAQGGEESSRETDAGENGDGFLGADAVDNDPADQERDDSCDAVGGIEPAEGGGGEAQLIDKNAFERVDAVVNVVVAAHGDADENKNGPAIEGGGCGASSRCGGSRHSSSDRLLGVGDQPDEDSRLARRMGLAKGVSDVPHRLPTIPLTDSISFAES